MERAGLGVALGLDAEERWLCALPLTHVGGLSILLRSAITATTAIVHERFDTERVLSELDRPDGRDDGLARADDAAAPARRRAARAAGAALGAARRRAVPPALLGRAAAHAVPVAPTYGLTEACSQVTTLGAPLFCTASRLAEDGEILVSGPTVAPGAGPVLRTGDLGAWNADGVLHVVGRKADTIVTGGENVAPAEVEAVLEAHPAVAEAAVHGVARPRVGRGGRGDRRPARGRRPRQELRAHCAARLAPFKVPKAIALRRRAAAHALGQARARAL